MKKKTSEEYIAQVKQINPNIIPLEKYVNTHYQILHKCLVCGREWKAKPLHILHNHGCPDCARGLRTRSLRMSHDEFVKKIKEKMPDIEVISLYKKMHDKVKIKCSKCGYVYEIMPYALLNEKKYSCVRCHFKKEAESLLKQSRQNIKISGDYVNSVTKTKFKCFECDYECEWTSTLSIVVQGNRKPCTMSIGARKIFNYLKSHNIDFETEKRFEDCKNIHTLPFDFYIEKLNMCIEYDGQQHFEPVDFTSHNDESALKNFKTTVKHDNIKNLYCKNNNIKLIRISYLEEKNIDKILDEILGGDAG